jgi:hypothetical protein
MATTQCNQDPIKIYRSGQVRQVAPSSGHTRPNRMPFRVKNSSKKFCRGGLHVGFSGSYLDVKPSCSGAPDGCSRDRGGPEPGATSGGRQRWRGCATLWNAGNASRAGGGRLAQRESASFTPRRSLVRSQYRPHRQSHPQGSLILGQLPSTCGMGAVFVPAPLGCAVAA